jgi:hypothetical protein
MAGPLAPGRDEKGTEGYPLAADVPECLPVVQGNRINPLLRLTGHLQSKKKELSFF